MFPPQNGPHTPPQRVEELSSHLQLVIFGAQRGVLLPDHLLQLNDQLLGLGQPLCHFLHGHVSASSRTGRAWALRRNQETNCVLSLRCASRPAVVCATSSISPVFQAGHGEQEVVLLLDQLRLNILNRIWHVLNDVMLSVDHVRPNKDIRAAGGAVPPHRKCEL